MARYSLWSVFSKNWHLMPNEKHEIVGDPRTNQTTQSNLFMWNIVEGYSYPIYVNNAPVKVVVTLTFQANSNGPTLAAGGPVYNVPPGTNSAAGLQPQLAIFPNQTVTASFDVAANGGFIFYGSEGSGVSQFVTFELEDILWGRG